MKNVLTACALLFAKNPNALITFMWQNAYQGWRNLAVVAERGQTWTSAQLNPIAAF